MMIFQYFFFNFQYKPEVKKEYERYFRNLKYDDKNIFERVARSSDLDYFMTC